VTSDTDPTPTATDELAEASLAAAASTAPIEGGLRDYFRTYLQRVRSGDLGSLPAAAGLVLLVVIFSFAEKAFFSLGNFANLITQAAPSVVVAMGLVFVLLLGEIDLSAGTASGVGGATTAVFIHNGMPWPVAVILSLAVGFVIGYFIGIMRARVYVPSFVVTLALFLALQGVVLWVVDSVHASGNISLQSDTLNALENKNMPVWLGWLLGAVCVAGYVGMKLFDAHARRSRGLAAEPSVVMGLKILLVAALIFIPIIFLNEDRALHKESSTETVNGKIVRVPHKPLEGVPWVVPLIIALVVALGFVLSRTRYGRHIYAVGGSDEAARRAGIRVDAIRVSVFVICSMMAVVSGVVLASRIGVNSAQGGGNTLLLAVGAAVIGGTSLFGGIGTMLGSVFGVFIPAVLQNGFVIVGVQAFWQQIAVGAVLIGAVYLDQLRRRSQDQR